MSPIDDPGAFKKIQTDAHRDRCVSRFLCDSGKNPNRTALECINIRRAGGRTPKRTPNGMREMHSDESHAGVSDLNHLYYGSGGRLF